MHVDLVLIERTVAAVGSVIVFVVAAIALKNDWKTPGIENHVFKIMLALLAIGGIVAFLAGIDVLGRFSSGMMYDKVDSRGVPVSKGIPSIVQIAGIVGVVVIFVIGGSVVLTSGWGHGWPASSVQRADLSGK